MVDDLRTRISELEQTQKDLEECLIETKRQLALESDHKILLEQQLVSVHILRAFLNNGNPKINMSIPFDVLKLFIIRRIHISLMPKQFYLPSRRKDTAAQKAKALSVGKNEF